MEIQNSCFRSKDALGALFVFSFGVVQLVSGAEIFHVFLVEVLKKLFRFLRVVRYRGVSLFVQCFEQLFQQRCHLLEQIYIY